MRIDSLSELKDLVALQVKIEKIFTNEFNDNELKLLAGMLEDGDELFWGIVHQAIDLAGTINNFR